MLNLDMLKDIVGDDQALLKDMLEQFVSTTSEDLTSLSNAVLANNARDVASLAHRIKGSCLVTGASDMAEISSQLETAGRAGDTSVFSGLSRQLSESFAQLVDFIDTM